MQLYYYRPRPSDTHCFFITATNTINREKEDNSGKSVSSAIVQSSVGLSPKGKAVPKDLPRVRVINLQN